MTAEQAVLADPPVRRRRRLAGVLVVVGVVALNIATYALLATEPAQQVLDALAGWTYPGIFLLSLVANAGIMVGLPYNAIVLQVVATAQVPLLVAVAAAAGSALGESTAWFIGRQGVRSVTEQGRVGRAVRRLGRAVRSPWRAFLAIAAFAAVPNYVFDVAGLAAGALGIGYRMFLAATFAGRMLRFTVFALAGPFLLSLWTSAWSALL